MDLGQSLAVYIDERVEQERWVCEQDLVSSDTATPLSESASELRVNVELLAKTFGNVYICNSSPSFGGKVAELSEDSEAKCASVFGFIDIGYHGDSESVYRRSGLQSKSLPSILSDLPATRRSLTFSSESEELSGLYLLSRFAADIQVHEAPSVIVPIAIMRESSQQDTAETGDDVCTAGTKSSLDRRRIQQCLDAGAVDVLLSPLNATVLHRLSVDAYRTQRAAEKEQSGFLAGGKIRKKSWVGATDEKPYAYLREAMVSKLMKRICNPELAVEEPPIGCLPISDDRKREIEAEVAKWEFSAHDLNDDELVFAASSMLGHALQLPELSTWRINTEELHSFLISTRAAYNDFVHYHNFRHAVDVLQSTFHFLVRIRVLPEYPGNEPISEPRSDVAVILTPFDALTLLITAIGHDVGHPGVNNGFLVKLNAPLAQLYNDKSVLEAFHCAAFSQILRRHWPAAFKDAQLRGLMISSILATDMGVHSQFMQAMTTTREDYYQRRGGGLGYQPEDPDSARALLCALLIKCADIGNVARHFNIARNWTDVLQQEFAKQGDMERAIGIETALFGGPPDLGDLVKKAGGQIGFMDVFALPLFDGVTELLPDMAFASAEIRSNRRIWKRLIEQEKAKELPIEIRPSEEDMLREQPEHPFQISHVPGPIPKSWKPRPSLPQYDGSSKKSDDTVVITPKEDCKECPPQPTASSSSPNDQTGKSTCSLTTATATTTSTTTPVPPTGNGNGHSHSKSQTQSSQSTSRSSLTATAPNRPSETSSSTGARTQSTSTYTNNTVMTPISSTTQASSVISGSSSCNGDHCNGDENGYSAAPKHVDQPKSSTDHRGPDWVTPQYNGSNNHSYQHPNGQSIKKSTSFMDDLLDRSFGQSDTARITLRDPTSAPRTSHPSDALISPTTNPSSPPDSQASNTSSMTASSQTVSRRRSRLRLAFWRRKKSSSPNSLPPPALPSCFHD